MEAYKEVVNWVVGVLTIGGVAVVRSTVGLRSSHEKNKVYNAETFVTKKAHERSEDRLLVVLDRLETGQKAHTAMLVDHIKATAK